MNIVLFGNATEKMATTRYRVLKYADLLRRDGHDVRVCLPSSVSLFEHLYEKRGRFLKLLYLVLVLLNRITQLRHVPSADAILFRGSLLPYGPPLLEYIIHRLNPQLIFDIDDAVWGKPAYVDSPFVRFMDHNWIWKMCRICRHGIVGNEYLQRKILSLSSSVINSLMGNATNQREYIARIRQDTKKWAQANLRGSYRNKATGWSIEITGMTIGKLVSGHRSVDHFKSLYDLPKFIELAKLVETHPDRSADPHIHAIHRLYSVWSYRDKRYDVKLTVKEYVNEKKLYDYKLIEIKISPASYEPVMHVCAAVPTRPTGDTQIVPSETTSNKCKIAIIPTCIDEKLYKPKQYPRQEGRPLVLGWTGLHNNLGYFEVLEGPLRRLARKYDFVLHIASGRPYSLEGVKVQNEPWTLAHELDYFYKPDIGLMPLVDSPRARGKCAYKAIQYMAVGTPCVISPVGKNASVIEDGVTGFLAATPEEWYDKLERLMLDPELRERMGRAARERMLAEFSYAANYPKLLQVLQEVAATR